MQATNPFSPPLAAVADIAEHGDVFQPVHIFAWRGRIGRLRFIAYSMLAYLIAGVLGVVIGAIAGLANAGELGSMGAELSTIAIALVLMAFVTIQRSHDMGWSGWSALLSLIPFVGLVWVFKSGSAGSNRFGAPPPPNTLGVKIVAFILPGIMLLGIVAAIALPAYQTYVTKAKAAQMNKSGLPQ
ncbi:MAG: DUF805 domain-containing protein [Rhodoferax sp.]|nr:DUF805 domain-containing protein [Rhodoferax sp.]